MKLHYSIQGQGKALLILHGLFGSASNWRGIAGKLAKKRKVIAIDLRNHGQSPHSDLIDYAIMADDIAELMSSLELNKVDVIGHSIGGKVAMTLADQYADQIDSLVVVDIAPRRYADQHSAIFAALLAIDLKAMAQRNDVDRALSMRISDKAIRQFLLMNIMRTDHGLEWQLNLTVLAAKYAELIAPVCENSIVNCRSLFLRGQLSDYIENNDLAKIEQHFPNATIETIAQAGHWIHAEKPDAFISAVESFLEPHRVVNKK